MTCTDVDILLDSFLMKEADPVARELVSAHLATCPGCRRKAEAGGRVIRAIAEERIPELPEHLPPRLATIASVSPAARRPGQRSDGRASGGSECPSCLATLGSNASKCDFCRVYLQGRADQPVVVGRWHGTPILALIAALGFVGCLTLGLFWHLHVARTVPLIVMSPQAHPVPAVVPTAVAQVPVPDPQPERPASVPRRFGKARATRVEREKDQFVRGERMLTARQYLAARDAFIDFLSASIGDPRIPRGRQHLDVCWNALIAQLAAEHLDAEAARERFEMELYTHDLDGAPERASQSRNRFLAALAAVSTAGHASDAARAVHRLMRGRSDDDAGPLSPAEVAGVFTDAVTQASTQRDLARAVQLVDEAAELGSPLLAQASSAPLVEQVAQARAAELLPHAPARALAVLIAKNLGGALPARSERHALIAQALEAHAQAVLAAKNLLLAEDLRELIVKLAVPAFGPDKIEGELAGLRAKHASGPTVLRADKPQAGVGHWFDAGQGFRIDNTLQVGDSRPRDAQVTIEPGFVLEGGVLYVGRDSTVEAQGTAEKPIVFRNVVIKVDLGGQFTARHALFDHCTLGKGGAWFGDYSARWVLSDCLLVKTDYTSFDHVACGIRFERTSFNACTFKPRNHGWGLLKVEGPFDFEWTRIEDARFEECRLSTSAVWMAQRSSFTRCDTTDWEIYSGKAPVAVALSTPDGDGLPGLLRAATQQDGPAGVTYAALPGRSPGADLDPLWALVRPDAAEPPPMR